MNAKLLILGLVIFLLGIWGVFSQSQSVLTDPAGMILPAIGVLVGGFAIAKAF